ncbi:type II toxin-antitoxin system RelE/ParE family toxin [Salegentibacter sp. F188]|uniref:Type II toxin-antitoxin system RelE/ParE family toxin n=1 Tax=Autumnicola patrickiae TaxID=3075591 RepID=A0ABU3E5U9_9FLAO|nr:type II toxin-antitoxin system RelE/ParE family toxin [Salegentibacter sp. F188]MDT0691320.1 type II toxin-antitoxin system RelE/ParE family toxin [Salegentibacter sp. F188]
MAGRKIIWTRTADIQLVGVLEYWVKRNKSNVYSRKLFHLVTNRTKQIAENPFLYKQTNFKNVRVASLGNFSIYYKAFKNEIIITSFWDNRQDPKQLLDILKNNK